MTSLPHYGGTRALHSHAIARALLVGATVDRHGRPYTGSGILVALHQRTCDWRYPRPWLAEWVEEVAPLVTAVGASPYRYLSGWRTGDLLHVAVVEAWSDAEEREALDAARYRGLSHVWHAGRQELIAVHAA